MVLPLFVAMVLMMAYNIVDSLWVGNLLGETAYAALTNSTTLIMILSAIAMGTAGGVSILVSQAVGAKDSKKTEGRNCNSNLTSYRSAFCIHLSKKEELLQNQTFLIQLQTHPSNLKERNSFCSTTKHAFNKCHIHDCLGQYVQHFCSSGLWNHKQVGNHNVLSGNGNEHGSNYNSRPV